jgi:exonuclease SbcC
MLKSVSITDFRSIRGSITVPLDAPVVLVHGQNGAGKTSLLSAIELALTGHVPSLARIDSGYVDHLVHKAADSSRIVLEALGLPQQSLRTELAITRDGITGSALLASETARYYNERCFLAQSTLTKLLEIYEGADAQRSNSPLTRFVRELLGLDQLDALIDGLYDAGDIRRLRTTVPAYWVTREEIASKQELLTAKTAERQVMVDQDAEKTRQISKLLPILDIPHADTASVSDLLSHISSESEEVELQKVAILRREVVALRKQWDEVQFLQTSEERVAAEKRANDAFLAYSSWQQASGAQFEKLLDQVTNLFTDISSIPAGGPLESWSSALNRVQNDLENSLQVLNREVEDAASLADLSQRMERFAARIATLDQQIKEHSVEAGQLASSLSTLLPHIRSEVCPVCNRDYREVSARPLHAVVTDSVAKLSRSSAQLQALSNDRSSTMATRSLVERERDLLAGRRMDDASQNALKARVATLREMQNSLMSIQSDVKRGQELVTLAAMANRHLGDAQSRDSRGTYMREALDGLVREYSLDVPVAGELPAHVLDRLDAYVARRESFLIERQAARRKLSVLASDLQELRARRASLESTILTAQTRLGVLSERKSAADVIIHDSRELARRARDVRTDIVRKVFNEGLNAIWRDLFIRLAPEEPFVPAFALPVNDTSPVEAMLETHYKSGGKGGNPRAMLSGGNVNTAALTLFLALHLSVDATLPWLVIDDPVQSMDEVHITQFAALLRTLSKDHNRQVVIAVHERPLFDYLALELSPAFATDRLITIELGRAADGTTLMKYEPIVWQPDKAIAA